MKQKKPEVQKDSYVGQRIVGARKATPKEIALFGWDYRAYVLVLENGNLITASQDEEGNGPGVLFGHDVTLNEGHYIGF